MPSVLAIVSKAVYERDAKSGGRVAGVGDVVPFTTYASKNKALAPAADGALFLVTVRPPDEKLWLVGILDGPSFDGETWSSPANTVPVTDITALKDQIKFTTGAGISAKKGALGMSLQTPRVLADADVALLRQAGGGGAPAVVGAVVAATGGPPIDPASRGHLNAHERGDTTPCLCRKCLPAAPERITVGTLDLVRGRAEAHGRFLWFWMPEKLAAQRDAIQRAVESQLRARIRERAPARKYPDLDKTLGGKGRPRDRSDDDE